MGANTSHLSKNLANNEYLARLAGSEHISPNDPYWNQLLSFSFVFSKTDIEQKNLEEDISGTCKKFVVNNLRSGNLGSLIQVFLMRSAELDTSAQCQNSMFTWQSHNALFIMRVVIKYLVENVSEDAIVQQFNSYTSEGVSPPESAQVIEQLIEEFYRILIELPIRPVTSSIHLEILNLLITILSIQVFQSAPYDYYNDIYRIFMQGKCTTRSVHLLQRLLCNYTDLPSNTSNPNGALYNLTSALGSGLWSVMTLGMGGQKTVEGEELEESISNQSLLLLLILCNYFHSGESHINPYHKAFLTLTDESLLHSVVAIEDTPLTSNHAAAVVNNAAAVVNNAADVVNNAAAVTNNTTTTDSSLNNNIPLEVTTNNTEASTTPESPQFKRQLKRSTSVKLMFSSLFKRLCCDVKHTHCSLFLYMLMHHNESIKAFILSRTDIDQLVLPILEVLYTAHDAKPFAPPSPPPARSSRDLYMALIILLILTEDPNFSLAVHDIRLKQVPWLTEPRQVGEISLGSIILLVLVRTIQYNMSRMRDQYLQTNCLGALANMSSQFKNVHPYVAQKLITLFSLMLKKYKKIVSSSSDKTSSDAVAIQLEDSDIPALDEDCEQESMVLEELMRMMLEVFNSCLCHSLNHNPHLIYSMLYQKDLFISLSTHPNFHDVVFNIEMILNYFSLGLDKQGKNLSVSEVQDFIRQSGLQFKKDRLKKFSDLNFHYVEEETPEEFFIPYAWCLVLQYSRLRFNTSRLRLSV